MDYLEKLREEVNARGGFMKYNHMHMTALEEGFCEIRTTLTEYSLNPHGVAHGGLLFSLCDTAAGIAATSMGRDTVTQSADIHFLRPGSGTELIAQGKVIKCGSNIAFCTTEIRDDQQRLVACANFEMFYIGPDKREAEAEQKKADS